MRTLLALCLLFAAPLAGPLRAEPLWVAVGESGRRSISRDGQHWDEGQRWREGEGRLTAIAYGNGCFVAIGMRQEKGCALRSVDGVAWREQRLPAAPDAIAFGRGRFVAVQGQTLMAAS